MNLDLFKQSHDRLLGVTPNQHHKRKHDISDPGDHTGRALFSQMPTGSSDYVLVGKGVGVDPGFQPPHFGRTATYVVAASDAPAHVKAQADYVCDGTADDVQIQAAIDALPADGGKVVLSEGNFLGGKVTLDNYVTIEGQGEGTIYKLADATNDFIFTASTKTGVKLLNFTVDGNKANQTTYSAGIYLSGCNRCLVDLYVHDVYGSGVNFDNITINSEVRGTIADCTHNNIIIATLSAENIVRITRSSGSSESGLSFYTSGIGYPTNNTVIGGVFESNTQDGIYSSSNGNENNNIVGAICKGNTRYGINLKGNSQAIGCYVLDNGNHGISVAGNGWAISNSRIEGNNGYGISVLADVTHVRIVGNLVEENEYEGMQLRGISHSIISNNIVRNNAQATADRAGIFLQVGTGESTDNVLMGNECYDDQATKTQAHGIQEANAADYNVIIGNDVRENKTAGIVVVGSNTIVRNNLGYITENSGSATVLNTTTSIVVNHGLATTPTRVLLTARLWSDAAKAWVTNLTTTQFTVNVDVDPGVETAIFDWRAQVGEG